MKKKFLIAILILTCLLALVLVGCVDNQFILHDLTVETPCKTVYKLGETLNIEGGVLKATYSNNASEFIPFVDERVSFSALDKTKAGEQLISVRFDTMSTTFQVVVTDVAESISLVSPPTKLSYVQGEKLSVHGLKIKVLYDGGSEAVVEVAESMVSGFDTEKVGEQVLTVSFLNNDKTLTTTFNITVVKKSVTSLKFAKMPQKINYKKGAELELGDAEFSISYSNNTPLQAVIFKDASGKYAFRNKLTNVVLEGEVVLSSQYNGVTTPGFDSMKLGTHAILFTYQGVTAYGYTIKVVEKAIQKYEISGCPKTIVMGTPLDQVVALWMTGLTIRLEFTDSEVVTYTLPQDVVSGKVKVLNYDPASQQREQSITFDFGINGWVSEVFTMQNPTTTKLELKSSNGVVLTGDTIEFYAGDTLDISKWTYELFYNNGTSVVYGTKDLGFATTVLAGEYDRASQTFLFHTVGNHSFTVGYNNIQTKTVNLVVKSKVLSTLTVQTPPTQTQYSVGEAINFQGIVLNATYVDAVSGLQVRVRQVAVFPNIEAGLSVAFDNTVAGQNVPVTLALTEGGVRKEAQFHVVLTAIVSSIAIKSDVGVKKNYIKDETFNPQNLVVTINYVGAPSEEITLKAVNEGGAWTFSPATFASVGTQSVQIGYLGKQVSLDVVVTNDIVRFEIEKGGTVVQQGGTFGEVTVGIVDLPLEGYNLRAVRQNGAMDILPLPNPAVEVVADNNPSISVTAVLEVAFTYAGITKTFYMTRLARQHTYYSLDGKLRNLQTASKGFNGDGWQLYEYFNNGAKELLTVGDHFVYVTPAITIPVGSDRVQVDVALCLKGTTTPIFFRRDNNATGAEVSAVAVMFYSRIATRFEWKTKPDILVDQNTSAAQVLTLLSGAGASFVVDFSDGTVGVTVALSANLGDFVLEGYQDNVNTNQAIQINYLLSAGLKVSMTLRINPKELISATFDGYLVWSGGGTSAKTPWDVVEGTDLDYQFAYLNVVYGFYYEGNNTPTLLPAVQLPVQRAWSDFDKSKAQGTSGKSIPVVLTYTYRGKKTVTVTVDKKKNGTDPLAVVLIAKSVVDVSLAKPPKTSYIEGENFTYNTDSTPSTAGVLRVNYNNGTFNELALDATNTAPSDAPTDPTKFFVVANPMLEYFTSVGGYQNVELLNGNEKTFAVRLRYMGKEVVLNLILKDRAYVTFRYQWQDGNSAKAYGSNMAINLVVEHNSTAVVAGEKSYGFRSESGIYFEPSERGFSADNKEYKYLPAGSYTIQATYGGVALKYNTAEADIGKVVVEKKELVIKFNPIPSITYGDPNPNFVAAAYLGADGFVAGEALGDILGYSTVGYIAYQGGVDIGVPSVAGNYALGVKGLSSSNYRLVLPGEVATNPYGIFQILRRKVYLAPTETNIVYGTPTPILTYQAFSDAGHTTPLADIYKNQLQGAPGSYNNGVALEGVTEVLQPNAGKYTINCIVMQNENPNFEIAVPEGKLFTIQKAELAVQFLAMQKTYGDVLTIQDFVSNLRISGWQGRDEGKVDIHVKFAIDGGQWLEGDAFLAAVKNVKTYSIKPGEMLFKNYFVAPGGYVAGNYTVVPKVVTVTAASAEKVYGTADTAFAYTSEGLLAGDTLAGVPERASGEDVARYAIGKGTLQNSNYTVQMAATPSYLTIIPRELKLGIAPQDLSKSYDGYAPSIKNYTLYFRDVAVANYAAGTLTLVAGNYISGTAPMAAKIIFGFSSNSPNKTLNPLSMTLQNADTNHIITFNGVYTYNINALQVRVKWIKKVGATDTKVLTEKKVSYPYIYGDKHYFKAVADLEGQILQNAQGEDISLVYENTFDSFYDSTSGYYGVQNKGTYSPTAVATKNTNFIIQSSFIQFEVLPNTIYIALDNALRSKIYDSQNALIATTKPEFFHFYEDKRAADGSIDVSAAAGQVEIVNVDYKNLLLRSFDFNVGDSSAGASKVGTYPIVLSTLGQSGVANFKAEFKDAESKNYTIQQCPVEVRILNGNQKDYDGRAPSLVADNVSSSVAQYLPRGRLVEMLRFTLQGGTGSEGVGDVGVYKISINTETADKNLDIKFDKEYLYAISKKEIEVTFATATGYYQGAKQLALTSEDVTVRNNNLGAGIVWSDVFASLKFSYLYANNTTYPQLNAGNSVGEKGNVGDYTITLNTAASTHKNYTFKWVGATKFSVIAAEVSVLPDYTQIIYGDSEENAPYKKGYQVRFERGSDGSSASNPNVFKTLVQNDLILDREKANITSVNAYSVMLGAGWTAQCVAGVHASYPNYKVSLSPVDGLTRFKIVKRAISMQIGTFNKTYGNTMTPKDIPVSFPNLASELKGGDTLQTILTGYTFAEIVGSGGMYGFDVPYTYFYRGSASGMFLSPQDQFATATREANGGAVYGYDAVFQRELQALNYTFQYFASGVNAGHGTVTIAPKTLTVSLPSFEWTYRDPWQTSTVGADVTKLNLEKFITIGGKIDGAPDTNAIRYPIMDTTGFADPRGAMETANAGTVRNIASTWFNAAESNSPANNQNYIFDFSGIAAAQTMTISKATLTATIRTTAGAAEISKTYGTLPQAGELKIAYAGFRGQDEALYNTTPSSVIATGVTLPNFVQSLGAGSDLARIAVLYGFSAEGHRINPNAQGFSATNYVVNVDGVDVANPFLFKVSKKNLVVRSAPKDGTGTLLKKWFGTVLQKDIDYVVNFGEAEGSNFITSVTLPDGTRATVEDSAQTVFYAGHAEVEWVTYNKEVNVIKNVATATEIAPNVAKMNEIGTNYNTTAAVGASLQLQIFNRILAVTTAHQEEAQGYGYITSRANTANNTLRIKIAYLNGEVIFVDLKVSAAADFSNANHVGRIAVMGYDAANVIDNLNITLTVTEANSLGSGGVDTKVTNFVVRNIPATDRDLQTITDVGFISTVLNNNTEHFASAVDTTAADSVARFNMVKTSFALMRSVGGGTFDIKIYNAYDVALATHRYVVRAKTGTRGVGKVGYQNIAIIEQTKQADGSYTDTSTTYYSIGAIDLFDQEMHSYQIYLSKLNGRLQVVVDNCYVISHKIANGTLKEKSKLSVQMTEMFGYVKTLALGTEGYMDEDAVRIVAKDKENLLLVRAEGQSIYVTPSTFFQFRWNYANDFYLAGNTPVIKYYLDGAETTQNLIALGKGTYLLTAKVFRSSEPNAAELSSASVIISVADGYVRDSFERHDASDMVIETITPTINNPQTVKDIDEVPTPVWEGKTYYLGKETSIAYTHYSLSFDKIQFTGYRHSLVDFSIKSNNPKISTFAVPASDLGYVGLGMRVWQSENQTTQTTTLKLVVGDGVTQYSEEMDVNTIDWTKPNGVYTINVAMDKNNLYLQVDVLFNNAVLHSFYMDGNKKLGVGDLTQYGVADGTNSVIENTNVLKEKAPKAWRIYQLASLVGGQSICMWNTSIVAWDSVLNTHTQLMANYIRTLTPRDGTPVGEFSAHPTPTATDSVSGGGEISYMIAQNGFAPYGSKDIAAAKNKYETYGVRFKATPVSGVTNKLRLILAENPAKTATQKGKRYTVNGTRNIALTFFQNSSGSRFYFSFNDSEYSDIQLDEFGEAKNFRHEQEIYNYSGVAAPTGKTNLFDGAEHTVVVAFNREQSYVQNPALYIGTTTSNFVKVYVDGKECVQNQNYYFPRYNNISPWNFINAAGTAQTGKTNDTAPLYDRYFLDERTYAGLSFRGLEFTLLDLSVSEKAGHQAFLNVVK